MAVIIDMDKPDNCHDCPMCEASRLPFWCMALSEKLPFDRNEIYKSIASDCPLKSADVQPVIHGEWEKVTLALYKCSECGNEICSSEYGLSKEYKYCSQCGAKMDKEQKNE